MQIVRDLFSGTAPIPVEMFFSTDVTGIGGSAAYKGQLCKIQDGDDIDEGRFVMPSTVATSLENLVGILAEDVAASTTYSLNYGAGAGYPVRKKIYPITNSTIIRAEYSRADAAGTSNILTGPYSAASTTMVWGSNPNTADLLVGGWIYWITGNNANRLHWIIDSSAAASTASALKTAPAGTGAATDTCLVIMPPHTAVLDFDATYTGIKSQDDDGNQADVVFGLNHYIEAPGINFQMLDPSKHDGLYIPNARFFHDFTIPSAAAGGNAWVSGVSTS